MKFVKHFCTLFTLCALTLSTSARAACDNLCQSKNLNWGETATPQKGWELFTLLIQKLIHTDAGLDTSEFKTAVHAFQLKHSIVPANGIIGSNTFDVMREIWNSRRPHRQKLPSLQNAQKEEIHSSLKFPGGTGELIVIATADAYEKLVRHVPRDVFEADPNYFKIWSAYRSQAQQDTIPRKGRTFVAKVSTHTKGRSIDLHVGGKPVTSLYENRKIQVASPAYRWLVDHACEYGFVPYYIEPWHWEYAAIDSAHPNVCVDL